MSMPKIVGPALADTAIPSDDGQQTLKPSSESQNVQGKKSDEEYSASQSLCTALVVPKGKRMVCLVEARLHKQKQTTEFAITSSLSRGCKPLMLVRVCEEQDPKPKIVLEQLPDGEQEKGEVFATVSTASLWAELFDSDTVFPLFDGSDSLFGHLRKTASDSYDLIAEMQGDESPVLTFFGDFSDHSIRVENTIDSRLVATVEACRSSAARDSYQVSIEAGVDAGLVLLGLLTIDKNECLPPSMDIAEQIGTSTSYLFRSFLGDPAGDELAQDDPAEDLAELDDAPA